MRARLGQLDHLVQVGGDGIPVLLGQQRIDLVFPERGRVNADAFQETGRAVRGQRVVEIENQGDDPPFCLNAAAAVRRTRPYAAIIGASARSWCRCPGRAP
ncbi:hypothetical protein G6F35_018110 [Rhizopus arrhizus]|nr:hypothetical protein G6F35_018110 [Rhizopus arrhizus]